MLTSLYRFYTVDSVFPGKHSGLIVDYANVFASLEKALAIYAKGRGGEQPIRDKQKLVESLRQALTETESFCLAHGVNLGEIEQTPAGSLDRLTKIAEAVERLISPDPLRKDFLGQEGWVRTLFQAVKPDPPVLEFTSRVTCLTTIAESIRERTGEGPADISAVMADLNKILDASVAADGFHIPQGTAGHGVIDLMKNNHEYGHYDCVCCGNELFPPRRSSTRARGGRASGNRCGRRT